MPTTSGASVIPQEDLKDLPLEQVQAKLGASAEGLTQAEARQRLSQYGYNEIAEKKSTRLSSSWAISGARYRA